MNRLNIQHLTQDLLTGPTYDLIKGTCKSVVELEYHLEEVFKATNDQLDWHNPKGRPYPHDLSKPLPLILDARGRLIIPYDHFINNDLEYLNGGSLSRKYTTLITKTKDADYGHIKWIEDKIPRNVYSKHMIIAVTSLKIMEFFGYKHLEEITVRRQDDKLYMFQEGDFKRLCRKDIEDMLLLLVHGKLMNLNVDERFALNVALRIKKTPYTTYRDIQGIIYQDDMDINHLMRTDELHKFSDGTLNHVRTSLNDIATGIQMDSSVSSDLVSKFINPSPDTGIDSILNLNAAVSVIPSSATIIPQTPIPIIQPQQQTYDSTTTITIPTTTVPEILNFASLFGFKHRVSSLESDLSKLKQTNQFAKALSSIPGIVDKYLATKMKDYVAVQLKSDKIREESQVENQDFLNSLDSNMKRIIKESDVQKNLYRALLKAYNSDKDLLSSYGDARQRSGKEESSKEVTQKKSKSTSSSKGNDDVSLIREATDVDERLWNPSGSRTPDREWNQTKMVDDRPPQQWMTKLAQASGTTSLFNEFMATPINFSTFIMNWLNIQNLTQDLLTGPTYDLIKGRPYPHDLSKPLPLNPDARGRLIIPYDHFINNDLEYLKGGSSSRKYTTLITKTKAADYGHIKWIEDKIPRSTWSEAQVVYDKHAYWGTYHWGPKRQRFYGYATNMETSKDVYSKRRIIAVTSLKIMEFFGYKHLEEIIVQRQDDKLYKFREGDFKRLCREDIEDMLLLLV
ncbi:hypothetical protein Tco_1492227 [Tanacetum coccineum]